MDKLDISINKILNTSDYENKISDFLSNFYKSNINSENIYRGLYIYGKPGCGKTYLVREYLKKNNYNILYYDSSESRNKNNLLISKSNSSIVNVLDMMRNNIKKNVIVIDEIEIMNSGDKSGLTSLIKLVRIKKTKKQKNEEYAINPIICISNNKSEKKIKELMNVCSIIEMERIQNFQIRNILEITSFDNNNINSNSQILNNIIDCVSCDLRKLNVILELFIKFNNNNNNNNNNNIFFNLINTINNSENTKKIVKNLFQKNYSINEHKIIINDNDRTIIGLLWHENIANILQHISNHTERINIYKEILDNICFADLIDRITFQKQVWFFGEYSSLIKTFYNNYLLHNNVDKQIIDLYNEKNEDIIFTKVLTKYSTEYNNSIFLQDFSERLFLDKKDLLCLFHYFKNYDKDITQPKNENLIANHEISKLDINRMYKIIDKLFS